MSDEPKADLQRIREMLGLPEPEPETPTPFALKVAEALTKAIASLRADGVIEVDDQHVDGLVAQIIDTALESSSVKKLPLRIVKTLIHSELVEEVYGTDEEVSAKLLPFLENV